MNRAEAALRKYALTYPQAYEEFPWGHSAFKVKRKVFLFLSGPEDALNLSVKLPLSAHAVPRPGDATAPDRGTIVKVGT